MTRFYGNVGFVMTEEVEPGVWEPKETPRPYFGDIVTNVRRWNLKQDSTNDDLAMNNTISIVADSFAMENLGFIKWVEFMGSKWRVTAATVSFPRIELSFGGVYSEVGDAQ